MSLLSQDEITKNLTSLSGWSQEEKQIAKEFQFKDFVEALSFVNKLGAEAEKMNHHPNWSNVYNKVTFHLNTHDAGDVVTDKDHKLAEAIDKLA